MIRQTVLLTVLSALTVQAEADSITLTISVTGAESSTGSVIVSLFDSEQAWMKSPLVEKTMPVDLTGEARVRFPGLSAGRFAAVVIYDKDADGELDTGFFGIPKEKIGFTNDARSRLGPASWKDASVDVSDDVVLNVSLTSAKQ